MPFEKIITTLHGDIGLWQLNDTLHDLLNQAKLSFPDTEKLKTFSTEKRKKEFLVARILLKKLSAKNYQIEYEPSGKPQLKNSSKNISISHSADFVCVFISEKNIGIDIEQSTRNIDRVASRFLHPSEKEYILNLAKQQEVKVLLWAAKEAIFKASPVNGIQFNQQIVIHSFQLKTEGDLIAHLEINKKKTLYKLNYQFIKNNVMVYCVEN